VAEGFVPLANFVLGARDVAQAAPPTITYGPPTAPELELIAEAALASAASQADAGQTHAQATFTQELVLLRLATIEAYERTTRRLLDALAVEVLGRELALAPADCEAIAAALLARFDDFDPIALAVSPADADRIRAPLAIRIDPSLGPGDLAIEVRDGVVESSFLMRLDGAVERSMRP